MDSFKEEEEEKEDAIYLPKKEGIRRSLLACLLSVGVPDLARTSRSTRLIDMSPIVSPDINPANNTRPATIMI